MLLVVQRGHVPRTTGATGATGEQQFARAAADRVATYVQGIGHQVRIIDADPPASAYRGDLFVALHYDSSASPSARGASVGYQTTDGRRFAAAWKRYYAAAGWTGGFRGDNYTNNLASYYGVRTAVAQGNRAAFIAEAGFHSNPADAALLAVPDGPDRVAWAIAAAAAELTNRPLPTREDDDMPSTAHEFAAAVWDHPIQGAHYDPTITAKTLTRPARDQIGALLWREHTMRNSQLPALRRDLAVLTEMVQELLAGAGDLTEAQVQAAAHRGAEAGARAAMPDVAALATAVAEAVDHDLDTAAVEQALRTVFGAVDNE